MIMTGQNIEKSESNSNKELLDTLFEEMNNNKNNL